MAFSIESIRKLKRTAIGHNPITSVSFNGISCTSQEDLKEFIAFLAQSIDVNAGLHQLSFNRFPDTIKMDEHTLDQLTAKTHNL